MAHGPNLGPATTVANATAEFFIDFYKGDGEKNDPKKSKKCLFFTLKKELSCFS